MEKTNKEARGKKMQPKFPEIMISKDPDNTNSSQDHKKPKTTAIY